MVCTAVFFIFFAFWAGGCCASEEEENEEVRGAARSGPFGVAPIDGYWTHAEHLRLAKSRIPPTLLEPLRPIRRC